MFLTEDEEQIGPVAPSEGWLHEGGVDWFHDPMGTERAWHDATLDTIHTHKRIVADQVRRQLEEGEESTWHRMRTDPAHLQEHFTVADGQMVVSVVNIVHTSYCGSALTADNSGGGGGGGIAEERAVLTHNWMWRRLMHLGCQLNHVHTSVKLCYAPPFNATHLVFQTVRVLETGAANLHVAWVMFQASLAFVQLAGACQLRLKRRVPQNIVATSRMPGGQGLCLRHLHWRNDFVSYEPREFAGAVIKHPQLFHKPDNKIMMLGFSGGAVVCVGGKTLAEIQHAYAFMYPFLALSTDTPENRQIETLVGSGHPARKQQ